MTGGANFESAACEGGLPLKPQRLVQVGKPRFAGELDAATGAELATHDGLFRSTGFDQVIKDAVHNRFIEGGHVAVAGEVELQRLGFDTGLVRDVKNLDVRAVGLASDGAERAELGRTQMDAVVAAWSAVGKDFQLGFIGRGWKAVLGAAQEVQVFGHG